VHWLSDVLAGAIVGTVVATATAFVAVTIRSRRESPLRTRDQLAD
jgi:membrane-associated phospholipid phosphatase